MTAIAESGVIASLRALERQGEDRITIGDCRHAAQTLGAKDALQK